MAADNVSEWYHAWRNGIDVYHDWRRETRLIHQALLIASWVGVMAVLAQLRIPLPWTPVPFTMQVFGVLLGAVLLGTRNGTIAQVAYVGTGAAGVPWFTGFAGGLNYMITLGTGGYLLAFPVASLVVGLLVPRLTRLTAPGAATALITLIAMLTGVAIIYLGGWIWLMAVLQLGAADAFIAGVAGFIAFDLAKAFLATLIALPFLPPAKTASTPLPRPMDA